MLAAAPMSDASARRSNFEDGTPFVHRRQRPRCRQLLRVRCNRQSRPQAMRNDVMPEALKISSRACRALIAALSVLAAVGWLMPAFGKDPQAATAPAASGPAWNNLPAMQLEAYYRAPLADTMIQRFRDPIDGAICYLYVPIQAPHGPRGASGYVSYGANTIGSLSCFANPNAGRAETRPAAAAAVQSKASKEHPQAPTTSPPSGTRPRS